MSQGHEHARSKQIKRHARLRDHDLGRPLWAGNDADWALILANHTAVICDRPGCRGPLEPKNFDEITRLRHLAYPKNSAGGCGHHDRQPEETPATDRGMSERHRWMQNRITAICRQLKYSTVPEHQLTQADVYVETTRTALKVQQRATDFARRTAARTKNGAAQTIWLLSHDANQPAVRKVLFELPAVRFKVVDRRLPREHRTIEFEPWKDIETLDEHAAVDVWATTWQLIETRPYLQTCKLDLHLFLKQVLTGHRIWVRNDMVMPPHESGRPKVGWVLVDDLDEVRARKTRDREAAQAVAAAHIQPGAHKTTQPTAAKAGDHDEPAAPPTMRQQKSVQNPAPPISLTLTGTKQPVHRETPTSTTTSRITYEQVEKLLNVAAVIVCVSVVGAFLVFVAHELVALWHFLATQIHGGGPVPRFLWSKIRGRPTAATAEMRFAGDASRPCGQISQGMTTPTTKSQSATFPTSERSASSAADR